MGGGIVRTLTGDHNDRVTDMTALILEPIVLESNQNHATITQTGICSTLPASMGMGGGYTPMIVEVTDTVIPIAVLGGGREHSTICMDETAPTLCTFQDSKPILIARVDNAEIL